MRVNANTSEAERKGTPMWATPMWANGLKVGKTNMNIDGPQMKINRCGTELVERKCRVKMDQKT